MKPNGKEQFDAIPIPQNLEKTVVRAARRGLVHRAGRQAAVLLCLLLAVTMATANISPFYAAASRLPVLGPIVRMMHVGAGGTPSESVDVSVHTAGDSVYLQFASRSGEPAPIPEFSVLRRDMPSRLVLHLHGIRSLDPEKLTDLLKRLDGVADAYPMAYSEPDEVGVCVIFRENIRGIVSQYANETLQLRLEAGEAPRPHAGYSLRSAPMPFGPELAELYTRLAWEGASQIRQSDGQYRVVLGQFASRERAEQAREGIRTVRGVDLEIYEP